MKEMLFGCCLLEDVTAAFYSSNDWEVGPDFSMEIKQAIVQSVTHSIVQGISVPILLEHKLSSFS